MSTSRFQGRNEGGVLFCVEAYATTNTCAIILTRHVPSTRAPPFPIKKIDIGGSPPSTQNLADVPPHATAAPTRPPSARSRCALLATYHLPLMHTHTHTPSRRRRSLLAASPPRRTPPRRHAARPHAALLSSSHALPPAGRERRALVSTEPTATPPCGATWRRRRRRSRLETSGVALLPSRRHASATAARRGHAPSRQAHAAPVAAARCSVRQSTMSARPCSEQLGVGAI